MSGVVSLSLYPWFDNFLIQYSTILTTLAILLLKYVDSIFGNANPGHFVDIHPNILLLTFSGIIRQEPLGFLIPFISDGLGKAG